MADQTPGERCAPVETSLPDRAVLLHILAHVEEIADLIERWRPVLDRFAAPKADFLTAASLRRRTRNGRTPVQ